MQNQCVFCELGNEYVNNIKFNLIFQKINSHI